MKRLHDLQHAFQSHLLNSCEAILEEIIIPPQGTVTGRMDIYAYAYEGRLIEVLEHQYASLKEIMGEEIFYEMCQRYCESFPSHYYSINDFGEKLPLFLATESLFAEQPYLSEWANLLLSFSQCLEQADDPVLSKVKLAEIPSDCWGGVSLLFHSSVQLLNFEWNILSFWKKMPLTMPMTEILFQKERGSCIVFRKENQAYYLELNPIEQYVFTEFQKKATLGSICEGLTQFFSEEEVPHYFIQLLTRWLSNHLFTKIVI